jgi:uncharacterized protein YidB (DUF937 family)
VGIQDIVNKMGGQQGAMDQMQKLFGAKGPQDIVSRLTQAGMGRQVQSWIGTGDNESISGDQIKQAVDPAALQKMSQQTGMEPDQVCDHAAQVLPHLMDQATPAGQMPSGDTSAMSKGKNAIKGMMGH